MREDLAARGIQRRVLGPREQLSEVHAAVLPVADDRLQSAADARTGGVVLVDHGIQRSPHRQVQVNGKADHRYGHDRRVELPIQDRPWANDQDEDHNCRCSEEGHQVVADAQGEDESHQHEQIVAPYGSCSRVWAPHGYASLSYSRLPTEQKPGQQRDRKERDRIDLLVDVRLTPDRESRRADEDGHQGAGDPETAVFTEVTEDVMHDEEPQSMRRSAHKGAQEVESHRDGETQRGEEDLPRTRQDHEQRITRCVRDPQDVGGGDVLAGVPERRGGRQGHDVQEGTPHHPLSVPRDRVGDRGPERGPEFRR